MEEMSEMLRCNMDIKTERVKKVERFKANILNILCQRLIFKHPVQVV